MADVANQQNLRNVDPEISALHDAYDALKTMDRPAQMRCLDWLQRRLAHDDYYLGSAQGKSEGVSK